MQKKSFASAILGVTPGEGAVMGLEGLLVGPESRWFADGERDVCILPVAMAEILGIGPEDVGTAHIGLMGRSYRVIGLIDGEAIDRLRRFGQREPNARGYGCRGQEDGGNGRVGPAPNGYGRD